MLKCYKNKLPSQPKSPLKLITKHTKQKALHNDNCKLTAKEKLKQQWLKLL
jgi:hypothetical protein